MWPTWNINKWHGFSSKMLLLFVIGLQEKVGSSILKTWSMFCEVLDTCNGITARTSNHKGEQKWGYAGSSSSSCSRKSWCPSPDLSHRIWQQLLRVFKQLKLFPNRKQTPNVREMYAKDQWFHYDVSCHRSRGNRLSVRTLRLNRFQLPLSVVCS